MAAENGEEYEWEFSKENVQPLKQGREFLNMSAALQPRSTDQAAKIKEQRQTFEAELRTYSGDDPLDVWDSYIKWTEQNYPKGGKDSHLQELLQRCVQIFREEEKYKNDPRNLVIWIKFANMCTEPVDIYSFMFNQGIGTKLAILYETWAAELESCGNIKKADVIFMQGLDHAAQPIDLLQKRYREFQLRLTRSIAEGQQMDTTEAPDAEAQRLAFGELKGRGKKATVPTNRVAGMKPSRGGLSMSAGPVLGNKAQKFQVFNDENAAPAASIPAATGEWASIPTANQENEQKPGTWGGARVKTKNIPVIQVTEVAAVSKPAFAVHEDANVQQPIVTPRKVYNVENVLSTKKPDRPVDPLQQMTQNSAEKFVVAYCKDKIYTGTREFSFEELRAAKYFKKKKQTEEQMALLRKEFSKEREKEALRLKLLEDDLQRQRNEQEEHKKEMMRQREELIQQHQMQQMQLKQQMDTERQKWQEEMAELLAQKQQLLTVKPVGAKAEELWQEEMTAVIEHTQLLCAKKPASMKDRSFNQLGNQSLMGKSDTVQSQPPASVPASSSTERQTPSNSLNVSARAAPFLSFSMNTTSSGSSRSIRTTDTSYKSDKTTPSLTAPSPTVNTKEAMHVVMGLFNETLEIEKQFGWHRDKATSGDDGFEAQFKSTEAPTPTPFAIYQEPPKQTPNQNCQATGNLPDKENNVLWGSQKRNKGGLQIAKDVPFTLYEDPAQNRPKPNIPNDIEMASNETVMSQQKSSWDIEPMPSKSSEMLEMTFAPPFSSTCNFTDAARLASTPFDPCNELASLHEPMGGPAKNLTFGDNLMSQTALETKEITATEESQNNDSRRTTLGGPPGETGLSPIIERSDEDMSKQSVASSLGSTHSSHSSTGSLHHTTAHATAHSMYSALKTPAEPPPLYPIMEKSRDDLSALVTKDSTQPEDGIQNMTCHEIDITHFSAPEVEDKKELFNASIAIDPSDPFDEDLIESFLTRLPEPLETWKNFHRLNEVLPEIHPGQVTEFGNHKYNIGKLLAQGGFAQVYSVKKVGRNEKEKVVKVQKPPCPWEFYIVTELHRRLGALSTSVDVRPSIMSIEQGYFFIDASCIVNSLHNHGTLVDFVNANLRLNLKTNEWVVILMAIEMLHILEQLHDVDMIHGDIKPDNFLLLSLPQMASDADDAASYLKKQQHCLKLIDFGRSIDMKMFPKGTTFTAKVQTSGFQCIEMKTNQPWTYQTDLFGLAGTIYVLLTTRYMNVYHESNRWKVSFAGQKRRLKTASIMISLFEDLLNISSCDYFPKLATYRQKLTDKFLEYFCKDALNTYLADITQAMAQGK